MASSVVTRVPLSTETCDLSRPGMKSSGSLVFHGNLGATETCCCCSYGTNLEVTHILAKLLQRENSLEEEDEKSPN